MRLLLERRNGLDMAGLVGWGARWRAAGERGSVDVWVPAWARPVMDDPDDPCMHTGRIRRLPRPIGSFIHISTPHPAGADFRLGMHGRTEN